jgi:hypothetical protein
MSIKIKFLFAGLFYELGIFYMKKVLNMRYLVQAYRFARDVSDWEMMEQYWVAIEEEMKNRPQIYQQFIYRRMMKRYRPMALFTMLRRLT